MWLFILYEFNFRNFKFKMFFPQQKIDKLNVTRRKTLRSSIRKRIRCIPANLGALCKMYRGRILKYY